jgi:hypothetical protein
MENDFNSRPLLVGFVVDHVELGQDFCPSTLVSTFQYHSTIVPCSFTHLLLKSLGLISWQSRHVKHFTRYPITRGCVLTATDRYRRLLTCTDSLRYSWLENLKIRTIQNIEIVTLHVTVWRVTLHVTVWPVQPSCTNMHLECWKTRVGAFY